VQPVNDTAAAKRALKRGDLLLRLRRYPKARKFLSLKICNFLLLKI
jgi:hypothetical protein